MGTLKQDQFQLWFQFNTSPIQKVSGNNWVASNFTPAVSGNLNKVTLILDKVGTPGTATVRIRATSSGTPTGADLASATVSVGSITASKRVVFTFGSPPALTSGTKYAIIFQNNDGLGGSPSSSIYYTVGWSVADYYGSGTTDYFSTDGGSTWTNNSSLDMAFVTEMDTSPANPVLDQFVFNSNNSETISSATTYFAQTFTPTVSGTFDKVRVHLNRLNAQTGGNVEFHVQGVDGSNKPDGVDIASQSVADSSIGSNQAGSKLTVTFSSPATLVSGTQYALVVKFPNAAAGAQYNFNVYPATVSGEFAGGRAWKSTNSGSTWGNGTFGSDQNMSFASLMTETVTTTQNITSDTTVFITTVQTITSDAFCGQETVKTILSDTSVFETHTQVINSDAFCGQETVQTIFSDAEVGATVQQLIFSDAFVGQETIQAILSNAVVQTTSTPSITSDAFVLGIGMQVITSDATVIAVVQQNIFSNCVISQTTSQNIQSDTVVIVNEPDVRMFVVI